MWNELPKKRQDCNFPQLSLLQLRTKTVQHNSMYDVKSGDRTGHFPACPDFPELPGPREPQSPCRAKSPFAPARVWFIVTHGEAPLRNANIVFMDAPKLYIRNACSYRNTGLIFKHLLYKRSSRLCSFWLLFSKWRDGQCDTELMD